MKRDKLEDMMTRRSPLTREAVAPVDLYDSQDVDKRTNGQTDKTDSGQSDKTTSLEEVKSTNLQVDKSINQSREGENSSRRRYTTYVRPQTIKAIKRLAVESEQNDYDIVQRALDEYLQRREL